MKKTLSPEILDLTRAMIDWMYFCPPNHYEMFPYSKDELRMALSALQDKKIKNKLHKEIKIRRS